MLELLIELSDELNKELDFKNLILHYEQVFFKETNTKE